MHRAARKVDAIRSRDTEMPCHIFEAIARQITRAEVVAPDSIKRVDQLASGHAVANVIAASHAAKRGIALKPLRRTMSAKVQRDAQHGGALDQEG
jgi:hypothetical protein